MNMNLLLSCVVWNTAYEATPAGADSPSLGDDKIRELKSATRERLAKEHKMDLSTGTAALDGWHVQGSAIDYYQASAPTTRPDGATALDSNDYGRRWYSTSTLQDYIYTASGWVSTASLFTGLRHGVKVSLTSGSGNWTVPDGVYKIRVTLVGGGGGGSRTSSGPGGGGGGTNISQVLGQYLATTPGDALAYSVGAGGAAGNGSVGGTGGTTTFAGATSATGGEGGRPPVAAGTGYDTGAGGAGPSGGAGSAGSPGVFNTSGYGISGVGGAGGGAGGMGAYWNGSGYVAATAGNYGGGGGGGNYGSLAGAGGSGIIIIEY